MKRSKLLMAGTLLVASLLTAGCSKDIIYRFEVQQTLERQPEAEIRLKRVDYMQDYTGTIYCKLEVHNLSDRTLKMMPQENELDLGPGTIPDSLEGSFRIAPRQRKIILVPFITSLPAPPKNLSLYIQGLQDDAGNKVPATFEMTARGEVVDE